jgi:hypothetical protein
MQLSNVPFSYGSSGAGCSLCGYCFFVLIVGSHYGTAYFGCLQWGEDRVRDLLLLSASEWL